MTKYVLDLEEEFDYQVIGVCTNLVDYRLAWEINQALKLNLKRTPEDYLKTNKKGETLSTHSLYEDVHEDYIYEYIVVKNKNRGMFLIPELELIDFFFLINNDVDVSEISKKLREVETIQTAVLIDTEEYKSFSQLVF